MALPSSMILKAPKLPKAAHKAIPSFRPDGSVLDLAALQPADIVWPEIAAGLSKIARFTGRPNGPAFSVAQHCAMGAEALFHETGDPIAAGYFLLHDAHEAFLGDIPSPTAELVKLRLGRSAAPFARALKRIKQDVDAAIYAAAGLAPPHLAPMHGGLAAAMDERMLRAEAVALYGPRAAAHVGAADQPPPKLTGAIRAWGPGQAEMIWLDRLARYLGIEERPS
ncbi:MAG: hypothetical protein MEQ84_07690 [Mesorhizobium sp.]|nr:hypothetical protein [Mesorhizobium sp.]